MPPRANPDHDALIAKLHHAHKTRAEIATALGRKGIKITPSGVHRALSRLGLAPPRKTTAKAKQPPAASPSSAAPPSAPSTEDAPEPDEIATTLRRALASLERAATAAEGTASEPMDVGRVVAAQRAITQLVGLLAKLTPPPPADIDARPDMIAAAQRGREAMHALLARLLADAA